MAAVKFMGWPGQLEALWFRLLQGAQVHPGVYVLTPYLSPLDCKSLACQTRMIGYIQGKACSISTDLCHLGFVACIAVPCSATYLSVNYHGSS
jgi:hypothetical protein